MIFDVTVPISNSMPVWPGDPSVQLTPKSHLSRDKTHTVHLTAIEMGSHTGTHVDAPFHMIDGGKRLSDLPTDVFVGEAAVLEIPSVRSVGRAELERFDLNGVERVLLKTENSKHWQDGKFYEEFVYLEPDGAQFLADRAVRLVGIDYLSIDKFQSESHPSHFVLLKKEIVIVEGLNLNAVPAGTYTMFALPLNLQDADGAPTRVILMN
ncbi:MAG TPA: cyclase family protein [Terriglobia bacterium]|nr:cyclase family protein [Terriglobia bacterium]